MVIMAKISRGKNDRNPPSGIPRDEIFVFEEKEQKKKMKKASSMILRVSYKTSEETSRNIARIGTAWLPLQQERQTSSHLCYALLVGNSTDAVSRQKHRRITINERSQFLCWIILFLRWTHSLL